MGWEVIAFTVLRRSSSPAGTTGTCVIEFTPIPSGQLWRVEGIAVICNSSTQTALLVYDSIPQAGMVPCQGTKAGNVTFDDQNSPLTIPGGGQLVLVWEGCSHGAIAKCRVQFQVLKGLAGKAQPLAV